MANQIHPLAVVEPSVELGDGIEIGPFAFVGGAARIGDGCVVHHHATIEGHTLLGRENQVFPYASIGTKTHDLKFKGGQPGLRVGDRNVFREYVSVHLATNGGDFTVVGSDNTILAYSHIAHDCVVGDGIVMSSHAALAGHVAVGDRANLGWNAGVHQFCRVGRHAMIGACSKVVQDVPPFLIADGNPAVIRAINKIGLERAHFPAERLEAIKLAYRILYREGLNRSQALEKLAHHERASGVEFKTFLEFAAGSERGFAPGHGA